MSQIDPWSHHKTAVPDPPPKKQRKGLRKVSAQRAELMREVGPERLAYKARIGRCMVCGNELPPQELQCDEIARGHAREACLVVWELVLVSCDGCHKKTQDLPITERLALRARFFIAEQARLYSEVRGTAPTHITGDDIAACV